LEFLKVGKTLSRGKLTESITEMRELGGRTPDLGDFHVHIEGDKDRRKDS
jgi:hypothetical protein